MYKITIDKNGITSSYTLPNESLRLLAYTKMNDIYGDILMTIESEQDAIEFLEKIGIKTEEV